MDPKHGKSQSKFKNKLEATEMCFLRRMLRIPWTAKKTNERVLNEANERRTLVRTMRKRQATFLGHRETDDSTAYRSGHWISLLSGLLLAIMFSGPTFLFLCVLMIAVAQGTPDYWTMTKHGSKYYLSTHYSTFHYAKTICMKLGGYLVELNSHQEQFDVANLAYYNGARDDLVLTGHTNLGRKDGRFYHTYTLKPMARGTYWRRRQPDNYKGQEHCTSLSEWGLNDINCLLRAKYICEVPLK
ncbi:C-type lectin domain family 4 member c [Plakobranchus ocellatus]|uniref:C-type lectin domain family 4 member c n=1 Tax=Plakobranchus ocellatus TaxID=259542 RepID=A0AAV4A8Z5_9GAST|nr:C-type lectin domain family 4 member c [Plakobranchus ocellatus]